MTGHGKIYVGERRLVRLLGVEFLVMVLAWTPAGHGLTLAHGPPGRDITNDTLTYKT